MNADPAEGTTADPDDGQPTTAQGGGSPLIAGRYRLIAEVGGGAMGVVWRARDETLGRDVAVKELRPATGMSGAEVRQSHLRARREGRIAARLQHPNAVTVYDVAEHDGRPYLIMEFVPSSTLGDILAPGTVLAPAEVARIGAQLASALAAAHAAGIVHRDIKPGNVLMTAGGAVKLTDFGISRATGDATVTATGEILGTPAYTAPEVAHGHVADFPADVFSLGSTLYAAVEGTPPFGDEVNAMAVLLRVVHNEIRTPRRSGPLTETLMRMLSPEPADRPTMKEVWQALQALSTSPLPSVEALALPAFVAGEEATAVDMAPVMSSAATPGPAPVATPAPTAPTAQTAPTKPAKPKAAAKLKAPTKPTATPTPTPTATLPEPASTAAATEPHNDATATATATVPETGTLPQAPTTDTSLPRSPRRPRSRRPLILVGGAAGLAAAIAAVVVLGDSGHSTATPVATPVATPHVTPTPKTSATPAKPPTTPRSTTPSAAATKTSSASSGSSQTSNAGGSSGNSDVASQLASTITTYYGLVPGNLTKAWGYLTPDYQQNKALGFDNYQHFWQGMQRIAISDVVAKAPDTVVITIDYYPKSGRPSEERTSFTLVKQDGAWKIERSTVLSSRGL